MIFKILKYFLLTILGIIILTALIATPLIMKARSEGERMYEKYDSYTRETLAKNFQLTPYPIKQEYQKIHPWKALKLVKFVIDSNEGERFKRLNTLDASLLLFMKMYTLFILPDYNYNLPMLSVDIIFMGGRRVFVIEIIDPARIKDDNLEKHYNKLRTWKPQIDALEKMEIEMEWAENAVTDFSIHSRADRTQDDFLFEVYQSYLGTYLEMAKNAEPISTEASKKVQEGMEWYVDTLLAKGGPAVNVFNYLLGPEKQKEYVRTVMFGVD